MLGRALLSFAVSVPIALIACSDDDSSSSSSTTPEQACDQAASLVCDKYEQCAPFLTQLGPGTRAKCVERFKVNCPSTFSVTGTSATPAKTSQCVTDAQNISCEDLVGRNLPPTCQTEPGTLADGAACGTNAQCKGKFCRLADASTCGACSTIGAAGAACKRDDDCDSGLGCAAEKCVPFAKAGESCDDKTPCLATLACNGGKCAAGLEAGVACTPPPAANPCNFAKGLFCHVKDRVCAQITTVAAGAACGLIDNGLVLCAAGDCKAPAGTAQGTCVAHAADGAACNDVDLPKCEGPARCVGGVCKLTDPATCK